VTWSTRASQAKVSWPTLAPSLLLHKWHDYDSDKQDRRSVDTKEARLRFLQKVAQSVDNVLEGGDPSRYSLWHSRYEKSLSQLGVEEAQVLMAPTLWRFVIGFGSNPALETGIQLHPLLGFPYLPGSAVRGLVHHVAEMTLEEPERLQWKDWIASSEADCELRKQQDRERLASVLSQLRDEAVRARVESFLAKCQEVREIFGSVHVTARHRTDPEGLPLPPTPHELLERWEEALHGASALDDWETKTLGALRKLLGDSAGGRVVFYDAVPSPGQEELLQVDILNPHYPAYYRDPKSHPPSDDQDPTPVYFLAVAPGKRFEFRYRWKEFAGDRKDEKGSDERRAAGLKKVDECLRLGLQDYGAGGKSAAGYGYFELQSE
jgi:CRISPR type III-B/RAMP module RAMP protein Cmr6